MELTEIIYHDVQESFGFGGPFIGKLEFQDAFLDGEYLVDGEKRSDDGGKVVFCKYIGLSKRGIFGLRTKRDFRMLVYDQSSDSFFQSKTGYEALSIDKMIGNKILFHVAFHTGTKHLERAILFDKEHFEEVLSSNRTDHIDERMTDVIVHVLEERLGRSLLPNEKNVFTTRRSLMAYEMIIDHISDDEQTKDQLEEYVHSVMKTTE